MLKENGQSALIRLVGLLLRANTAGMAGRDLVADTPADFSEAFAAAVRDALRTMGPEGLALMESCYDVKVPDTLKASLGLAPDAVAHGETTQKAELLTALSALLADVESIACDKAAYGFSVEDEQHPYHNSVLQARAVCAKYQPTETKEARSYNVNITRVGYRSGAIVVKAASAEKAIELALAQAGGYDFSSEYDFEYEVQSVEPVGNT